MAIINKTYLIMATTWNMKEFWLNDSRNTWVNDKDGATKYEDVSEIKKIQIIKSALDEFDDNLSTLRIIEIAETFEESIYLKSRIASVYSTLLDF